MRILLHGATGRIGQMVIAKAGDEIVAKVSPDFPTEQGNEYQTLAAVKEEADIVIDFSNHASTKTLLDYCVEKKLPVVVCTTGQSEEEKELIAKASQQIPIFFSANMSIGVATIADLAKRAAAMFPDADIEIIERHHNQKLDVPSGTALMIANSIKEVRPEATYVIGRHEYGKRTKEEIGIHSLRYGNEVGTHEIIIATGNETITIKHEAENRGLFADGALKAANFLVQQPSGLYNMNSILG